MTWSGNVTQQVKNEFADAQRRRGAKSIVEDDPIPVGPRPTPKARRSPRIIPHRNERQS